MLPVNLENIGSYQMKAKYDAEVDVLTITWHDTPVEESEAISPGVILDYDQAGNVIGIEILNASRKIENFSPNVQVSISSR